MDVGFIGLGNMGAGIARSLLRAGHRLTVYNRTRERAETLRKDGARVATSVAEASHGEAVLTMLADDAALESVAFGDGGILRALPRGHLHVSLSTISVELSDKLTAEHARAEQQFLAAPVFGRPEAADAARLIVVCAGAIRAVEQAKPLLEVIGQKLVVIGERPSQANVVKLTGNFLIASMLESLSEAFAFARKSGIDPGALLDFLTSTIFNVPAYKMYGALIVEGKHDQVGFAVPLGLKDIRLVLQAAEKQSVPMPIASVLRDRFLTALGRGYDDKDWSVIGRVAAEDAGLARAKPA
jgi:3-hydroxyisobutyrate dehydrogenase-like beta-hydroxyacid dehydrogenase